jgi:transposase-like protein
MNKHQYRRRNADQWQEIIAHQEASGESVSAYCRQQNLCEKSLYIWRKRLRKKSIPQVKNFIEVSVPPKSTRESLRIKTPGGYCLEVPEGTDSTFVKSIIAALVSK